MSKGQASLNHPKQIVFYVFLFWSTKTFNKQVITGLFHKGTWNKIVQTHAKQK